MTAIELLSHPLAQRLTWTLAHFVWQGFLIAAVLAVIVEVLRPRSANVRYALSLSALILMLTMVVFTWMAIGWQSNSRAAATPLFSEAWTAEVVEVTEASSSVSWWIILQPLLFCTWLLGSVLLSLRLLLGWLATQTLMRRRARLPDEIAASLSRVSWRLRYSVKQVVFASEHVSQAIAVGFFKPVVLLPAAWLLELPPNLLEAVVAHELAHLRRCDLWVNFLQRIAEAFLFYHPAIWWLSARLRRERELCCDELAVSATGLRLDYAEALEFTARWALVGGRPALATGFFGEGKMTLLHRVRCVLGISSERPASFVPAGVLLGSLSLALLAAIYATSPAQADDDAPKAGAKDTPRTETRREGERRDGEVRRDGDRPREGAEVRRDGDKPREGEVRRDGDRPRTEGAPRDGERRPEARKPDPNRAEGAPREGARDGDRPRELTREGARPATGDNAELLAIIRQLRAEMAELRAEVARLKGASGANVRRPGDGDLRAEPRREGDRPREGGDRPREGARDGDRPKAEGDRR
ncbi:M56 family metallopeptidase [Anatilimnocola floriformis]|uniref:M56 family metallopeptidase n=1 Tax=Anatilimnocola floriformis TaxID=2948575 RepID=UPI0020C1DF65|nr:M56 family metallopeptidase [Anatilimnocola floriformis]